MISHNYNGQVLQDKFVVSVLKNKNNGFFLEIGSNHPKLINNSYVLEKELNWNGIMIDYNPIWLPDYKVERPNSIHVIDDATQINYYDLLKKNNVPNNIDYLQIDLETGNRSTLTTLEILDNTIFDEYKFATITFEHDIYAGDYFNTRVSSRDIFTKRGYILVFPDVRNGQDTFEDWYIHPDLVDVNYINKIKFNQSLNFPEIMEILDAN
jgi:hypothetical protein